MSEIDRGRLRLSLLDRPMASSDSRWPPLWTPPRRRRLNFRIGDRGVFFSRMLDRFVGHHLRLPREESSSKLPFHDIRLAGEPASNWLAGLLHAWSEVVDILGFYQERWVQEGFLRTAVEDVSVFELARAIGYQPRPATAGTAWTALLLAPGEELPATLDLAPGLRVQAVPADGLPPQSFELAARTRAERRFNRLSMLPAGAIEEVRDSVPSELDPGETGLLVRGANVAPGEGLLVRGTHGTDPFSVFNTVVDSKAVVGYPGLVELTSAAPFVPANAEPDPAHIAEEAYVFRQPARLFGAAAPLWPEVPIDVRRRARPVQGGVCVRVDGALVPRNGTPAGFLPMESVRALFFSNGVLLAAGAAGAHRSVDRGITWTRATDGLVQPNVHCLAADGKSAVLAGTAGGVYRSTDMGRVWERASGRVAEGGGALAGLGRATVSLDDRTVRALLSVRRADRIEYFAGADDGLFASSDMGSTWRTASRGLPRFDAKSGTAGVVVYDLAAGPDGGSGGGRIFAGTSAGVYASSDRGKTWEPRNLGLPDTHPISEVSGTAVFALLWAVDRRRGVRRLFAATALGLFRSDDDAASWAPQRLDPAVPADPAVRCLAAGTNSRRESQLFAGTVEGLYSSLDHGSSWTREPVPPSPIDALAADGADVALARPFAGFEREEWPGFSLRPGEIDVESQVSGVVAGGFVILDRAVPGTRDARALRIRGVQYLERRDFSLISRVTRLFVDPAVDLSLYDLRTATVWLRSQPLLLARDPLLGWAERLDRLIDDLRQWGTRPVLGVVENPFWQTLLFAETLPVLAEANDEALEEALEALIVEVGRLQRERPLAEPLPASAFADRLESTHAAFQRLRERLETVVPELRSPEDLEAVAAALAASRLAPALLRLATVALGGTIEGLDRTARLKTLAGLLGWGEGGEELRFEAFGNTGPMVEGTTVTEVLGSGDADQLFQRFTLSRSLAWDEVDGELLSTLDVRVDDQRWRRVPSLYERGGEERVYAVRRDLFGRDQVIFGDGVHGALLPNGRENVRAVYRTEISSRPVASESLTMIQSRPLGLARTFNPYAGTPGALAEGAVHVRRDAPLGTRAFGRVVSRSDYEDFVRDQPGVTRVAAFVVGAARLQVTVAFEHTLDPYRAPDALGNDLRRLRGAILAQRDSDSPFDVQEVVSRPARLDAIVRFDPALVTRDAVGILQERLRALLDERFGFAARAFATTFPASEVVRALQELRVVRMVRLCDFGPVAPTADVDPPPECIDRSVAARPGRLDGEIARPAEIAWLDVDASVLRLVSLDDPEVRCEDFVVDAGGGEGGGPA